MARVKRDGLPMARKLAIAEADLENARAALDAIPEIERLQVARVEAAKELYDRELNQLNLIRDVEAKEAQTRVNSCKSTVASLRKRVNGN